MSDLSFTSRNELEAWLSDKPDDWALLIATRAALRAFPYLNVTNTNFLKRLAIPTIRGLFLSWVNLNATTVIIRQVRLKEAATAIDLALNRTKGGGTSGQLASDAAYLAALAAQSRSSRNAIQAVKSAGEAAAGFVHTEYEEFDRLDIVSAFPETAEGMLMAAMWHAVSADCRSLLRSKDRLSAAHVLTRRPLWFFGYTKSWRDEMNGVASRLKSIDPNYDLWIAWFERRILGERSAFDIPEDRYRKEDKAILRRLADATDEDFWDKGHKYVNAELTRWLEEARARAAPPTPQRRTDVIAAIKAQASPQAQIIDGKLDAAPNSEFDKPVYSDDLADLPSQLLAIADVILKSLPRNCEPVVKNCFAGFRDELLVRGNRPILNIVKAMAASLIAELYGVPDSAASPDTWPLKDPREWGAGMDSMFASFFKGYHDLIHHFPMDSEREALIAATLIDEMAASGAALTKPINAVAEMIVELGRQGFATDNIVRIIEAHQLYTRDVAQLPPPDKASNVVTPKRRHVLGTLGFYLQSYNLIASTASIYSLPAGTFAALAAKLKEAADALLDFVR